MASLREQLLSKSRFGFDLDETLYSFRTAFTAAPMATLIYISTSHQILLGDVKTSYKTILARGTWNSFADSQTSTEYQEERFAALMGMFYISPTSEFLEIPAERCKSVLENSLEVKIRALDLLRYLKESGKKVLVISEGPQDAQSRLLKRNTTPQCRHNLVSNRVKLGS